MRADSRAENEQLRTELALLREEIGLLRAQLKGRTLVPELIERDRLVLRLRAELRSVLDELLDDSTAPNP